MKSSLSVSILGVAFIALISCNSRPQEKEQKAISEAESAMFADSSRMPVPSKVDSMIAMYLAYADTYQDDTLCAEYLFRSGDLANGIGRYTNAIGYFGRVQRYPNYKKCPEALFLQGFISESALADTADARKYYEKFIQLYPTHILVKDARASLDNMGKTPEQLIKEFEAKLNSDSLAIK